MIRFGDYLRNIFWILLLLQFGPPFVRAIKQQYSDLFEAKTQVGVISIKEALFDAGPYIRDIRTFFQDPDIKAILLKIECGGGAAGSAQALYHEINHYKSLYPHKYVIAFIENIAGSCGYYIASAAHYIIASPGAFIGNIGGYIPHPHFKETVENRDIKYSAMKLTEKAAEKPIQHNPEEEKYFQSLTQDIYRQFVRDIMRQRPHVPHDTKTWAAGQIFTGDQALALKLIDEVGSPSTIARVLKEQAHITGKIKWVQPTKNIGFLGTLLSQGLQEEDSGSTPSAVSTLLWHAAL